MLEQGLNHGFIFELRYGVWVAVVFFVENLERISIVVDTVAAFCNNEENLSERTLAEELFHLQICSRVRVKCGINSTSGECERPVR